MAEPLNEPAVPAAITPAELKFDLTHHLELHTDKPSAVDTRYAAYFRLRGIVLAVNPGH
jgi:hypothetical protein